jgi:predicted dehydrogenase
VAVRIGVIGVGFGSTVHIPAFQAEGLEVTAVCASRPERAAAAAAQFSIPHAFTEWEELVGFAGIDAVSIATPVALHHRVALAALAAGKHVICEKPFALDAAAAKEMWEAARASDRTAMVAHEFRFASGRMRVHELLGEGYIGSLRLALLRLVRGGTDTGGAPPEFRAARDSAASGAGFLFGLGSHYLDGLRHWFGEVRAVSGTVVNFTPERTSPDGPLLADADDTFLFTLEFASGGIAQMVASRAAPFGADSTIELYGDAGTLVAPQHGLNPPAHGVVRGARLGDAGLTELEIPARLAPFVDDRDDRLMPFRLFTRAFLRGVDLGTSPAPNFYDGWRNQQLLDAIRASSASGQRIEIPAAD